MSCNHHIAVFLTHYHRGVSLSFKGRGKTTKQKLEVVVNLLNAAPFRRLPLIIHLVDDCGTLFDSFSVSPPLHMPIKHGKLIGENFETAHTSLLFAELGNAPDTTDHLAPEAATADAEKCCNICRLDQLEVFACL